MARRQRRRRRGAARRRGGGADRHHRRDGVVVARARWIRATRRPRRRCTSRTTRRRSARRCWPRPPRCGATTSCSPTRSRCAERRAAGSSRPEPCSTASSCRSRGIGTREDLHLDAGHPNGAGAPGPPRRRTTMVYTHVLNRGGLGVVSPVDLVLGAGEAPGWSGPREIDRAASPPIVPRRDPEDGDRRSTGERGPTGYQSERAERDRPRGPRHEGE